MCLRLGSSDLLNFSSKAAGLSSKNEPALIISGISFGSSTQKVITSFSSSSEDSNDENRVSSSVLTATGDLSTMVTPMSGDSPTLIVD